MPCNKKPLQVLATVILLTTFSAGCKSGGQSAAIPDLAAASPSIPAEPTYPDVQLASRSSATGPTLHRAQQKRSATGSFDSQFCPVTGAKLGSMGKPVSVSVAGQRVYVCCAGCVEKLRQNPDTYLQSFGANRASTSPGQPSVERVSSVDSGSGCGSAAGNCGSHCH